MNSLRPLGFGEILDRAFAMYRKDFTRYFTTSITLYLPLVAFWIGFAFLTPGSDDVMAAIESVQLLMTPYSVCAVILIWGALTYQADRAFSDEPPSTRESYAAAGKRFFALLGASVLVTVGMALGFLLLVIPGILFAIMCFGIYPAIVLENRGPVDAIKRSRALARGAWKRVFGIVFILMIITSLPTWVVSAGGVMGVMADAAEITSAGVVTFVLTQAATMVVSALMLPLFVIGVLVLYYDRRVRLEGLDLEMESDRLAAIA